MGHRHLQFVACLPAGIAGWHTRFQGRVLICVLLKPSDYVELAVRGASLSAAEVQHDWKGAVRQGQHYEYKLLRCEWSGLVDQPEPRPRVAIWLGVTTLIALAVCRTLGLSGMMSHSFRVLMKFDDRL